MRHCTKYIQIRAKYYCTISLASVCCLFLSLAFESFRFVATLSCIAHTSTINTHALTLLCYCSIFCLFFTFSGPSSVVYSVCECVSVCFFAFLMEPILSSRPPIHLNFPSTKCYQFIHFFHSNLFIHSNFK